MDLRRSAADVVTLRHYSASNYNIIIVNNTLLLAPGHPDNDLAWTRLVTALPTSIPWAHEEKT